MLDHEYAAWLTGKNRLVIKPEKDRHTSIAKLNPDLHFISELLICRRATAMELLKYKEEGIMRESYMKYLEMIEQEIKTILVLE